MHGLASHGVEGMGLVSEASLAHASMTHSAAAADSLPMAVNPQELIALDKAANVLEGGGLGHGDMDMSIAMMCVAILGAALLALLHFLRGERASGVLWSLPRQPRVILHPGRGPGPPSLSELSIQRC